MSFMKKRISHWIEPEVDKRFILRVRGYGLKQLEEVTGVGAPTISRWLSGEIGMKDEWYRKILRRVAHVKAISLVVIHGKYGDYYRGHLQPGRH